MTDTVRDVIARVQIHNDELALAGGPVSKMLVCGIHNAERILASLDSASPEVKLDLIRRLMPEPTLGMVRAGANAPVAYYANAYDAMRIRWRAIIAKASDETIEGEGR